MAEIVCFGPVFLFFILFFYMGAGDTGMVFLCLLIGALLFDAFFVFVLIPGSVRNVHEK